jgi:hypothetical protein
MAAFANLRNQFQKIKINKSIRYKISAQEPQHKSRHQRAEQKAKNHGNHELNRLHSLRCMKHECEHKAQLLVLTPIAKPMNRFAACGDLRAEGGPRIAKMTQDEMVEWFKSAPKGSRHERMLWAARKIARLTGVTDGRAYQMLLGALIEAERVPPDEYLDVLGLTR